MRVGIVGGLIGLLIFGSMLRESAGDPFIIAALAQDSELEAKLESELGREVWIRSDSGHDGKFFLIQAMDPFMASEFSIENMKPPRYRAQRMLYPTVAGLAGLAPLAVIPWLMGSLHILALGVGSAATARLAERRGISRWWGLAFALNPGVVSSLLVGGATTIGLALALWGVVELERDRSVRSGIYFAASLLARETLVLLVAGALLADLWKHRKLRLQLGLIAATPSIAWAIFLRFQIPLPDNSSTNGGIVAPLSGIRRAIRRWDDELGLLIFALLTILAVGICLWHAARTVDPFFVGCALFGALFVVLAPVVLREHFDYSRVVAPVYIGFALFVGLRLQPPAMPIRETTHP